MELITAGAMLNDTAVRVLLQAACITANEQNKQVWFMEPLWVGWW